MSGGRAASVLAAAGVLLGAAPLHAQQATPLPPSAELDPDAPLDPMPDIGLDWPELPSASDPTASAGEGEPARVSGEREAAVRLAGLDGIGGEQEIREAFAASSALDQNDNEDSNAAQIDRRSSEDSELLVELLRSQGYYSAEVDAAIETADNRITVILTARPGPRYTFEGVELPGLAGGGDDDLRKAFDVRTGDPVIAQEVIDAGNALRIELGEKGYATAQIGEQDIVIDHDTATARLVLPVTPGPVGTFGTIRVSGAPPFPASHVATIARFDAGDRFDQSDVDDLRRALVATGLVASAEVRQVPRDGGRTIDLEVALTPAPPRTVAGELGYGTGEGLRAEASWQHRNFFNPEGALTVRGVLGTQEQLLALSVRRNNMGARDRVGSAQLSASHVERDAYEARTASLTAALERQSNFIWQKPWTWSVGTELLASGERDRDDVTGLDRRRTYKIIALPLSLAHDASDDLLDPTQGFRIGLRASPEASTQNGERLGYARLQVDASAYYPVSDSTVLAARVRFGSILGGTRDDIAPSRRLYSGGGGSVRGYGYQRLGPRDAAGDPAGGKSLAEFGLEARVRLGNFAVVPFFDGGHLTTDSNPIGGKWQFGAGLGARYHSSFGPIRIDGGTPLNRQEGDSRGAVVVSLGQAV